MSKIVVGTFLTLDGVMQAPGASDEDLEGGFPHGGWQMGYFDEEAGRIMDVQMAATDALLLGRITYQLFAAYWPNAPEDAPGAALLNGLPKYVVSTTLDRVDWNNSRLIRSNVVAEIDKLKRDPATGTISVVGSGKLAQTLMQHGLVDEYALWIHPVVLGSGKRLFEGGVGRQPLRLADSQVTPSGIVVLTYRPESAS